VEDGQHTDRGQQEGRGRERKKERERERERERELTRICVRSVRDPANATQLSPDFNSGDYLHLSPAGYRAMADSIDLSIFDKFADGVHTMT